MNKYLLKYGFKPPQLTEKPSEGLGLIVVIPCHNEKEIIRTLESLIRCESPNSSVKIILVINQSEVASDEVKLQNKRSVEQISDWKIINTSLDVQVINETTLPKKHAGVGLARKIGMDEAVYQFDQLGKDGIIVALDADCEVEPNYLVEIEKHFVKYPKSPGCSIRYAHPLEGEKYPKEIYQGIINYELHLRYYNQALVYCGLPYAFHTVGSSMAVKSSAYQKQGGMNRRKAGEDFYFLQKIIELENFTELNTACVIPSPRVSDRVPFGTGKAIGDWIESESVRYETYSFDSFVALKGLVEDIPIIYKKESYSNKSKALVDFLSTINFENKVKEIKQNTTNYSNFEKRFFTFFNAFIVLKFVHFSRDNYFPNTPVHKEAKRLIKTVFSKEYNGKSIKEVLESYRILEQSGKAPD